MTSALALAEDLKTIVDLMGKYGFYAFVATNTYQPPKYAVAHITQSQEAEFDTFVLINRIKVNKQLDVQRAYIYGYLS